ncbi:hypothetical protein B0H13DRAFT_1896269 [Mycena leptocephala]|nr:hypothetical protein B0H13DRAFT_1896269 [Mycena leptocephala]
MHLQVHSVEGYRYGGARCPGSSGQFVVIQIHLSGSTPLNHPSSFLHYRAQTQEEIGPEEVSGLKRRHRCSLGSRASAKEAEAAKTNSTEPETFTSSSCKTQYRFGFESPRLTFQWTILLVAIRPCEITATDDRLDLHFYSRLKPVPDVVDATTLVSSHGYLQKSFFHRLRKAMIWLGLVGLLPAALLVLPGLLPVRSTPTMRKRPPAPLSANLPPPILSLFGARLPDLLSWPMLILETTRDTEADDDAMAVDSEEYKSIKAMADADYAYATTKPSRTESTADNKTIFHRVKNHKNPTQVLFKTALFAWSARSVTTLRQHIARHENHFKIHKKLMNVPRSFYEDQTGRPNDLPGGSFNFAPIKLIDFRFRFAGI